MKITQIAAATLVPAAVAGAVFTSVPFAQAAPATPAAHVAVQHTATVKPRHHKAHRPAKAQAGTRTTTRTQGAEQGTTGATGTSQTSQGSSQSAAVTSDTFNPQAVSSFEQCVAWRESGNTPTDPDGLFGILPYIWHSLGYSGTAGQAPVSVQQQAFDRLYAQYGAKPWAPSDGC